MNYSLSKNNYTIEVNSLGAEMVSLCKDDVNYLWTKAQPYWQRHAPVLFPIVGKLKENTYIYNGASFSLPQHGFARDSEFELAERKGNSLLLRLKENENPNYPFRFDLFIEYSIDPGGVKTSYIVENKGEDLLPFSVGAHPGFLCPLNENETLEDYYFEFEDDEYLERDLLKDGLRTGETQSLRLVDKKLPLSEMLFKDDALVLSGFKSKWVALKTDNYMLNVSWDDISFLGLWKQPNAPFVCIEPWWGVADSLDHNKDIMLKEGIIKLEPGHQKKMSFTVHVT